MTECEELSLFRVLKSIGNIYLTETSFGFRRANHQSSVLPKVSSKGESSSTQVPTSQSSSGLVLGRSMVFPIIDEELVEEEEVPLVKKMRRTGCSHSVEDSTVMSQDGGVQGMGQICPISNLLLQWRGEKRRQS